MDDSVCENLEQIMKGESPERTYNLQCPDCKRIYFIDLRPDGHLNDKVPSIEICKAKIKH